MKNYLLLCETIKASNLDSNSSLSDAIIEEHKCDKLSGLTKNVKTFYKDNFTFSSLLIEKKFPKKLSNKNILNYNMVKKYCSYLLINHIDDHISIILSDSDSLNDEQIKLSKWNEFINNANIDKIFEVLLDLTNSRIHN